MRDSRNCQERFGGDWSSSGQTRASLTDKLIQAATYEPLAEPRSPGARCPGSLA